MSFLRTMLLMAASMGAGISPLYAIWNAPHPIHQTKKISHRFYFGMPKTLDPGRSYASNESTFLGQIVEPPLTYDYLKTPYTMIPLTLTAMPVVTFINKQGQPFKPNGSYQAVAKTLYRFTLRQGIRYQPHPAFVREGKGWRYWPLHQNDLNHVHQLSDFKEMGTRSLLAQDYVYGFKRLADPRVACPIYPILVARIMGFKQLTSHIQRLIQLRPDRYINYNKLSLVGVRALSNRTFEVITRGYDPQFLYWFTMSFMAPIPWEVDRFYAQPALKDRSIGWDTAPVGTGAYYLSHNEPYRMMVLSKNPYYHTDYYPNQGSEQDRRAGLLKRAGQRLPMIDQVNYYLEKEQVPIWSKFRQGFYDASGVASDQFAEAIQLDDKGYMHLTPQMKKQGVKLYTRVEPAIYYMGFNMLNPVVGGKSVRARDLRHAIAYAVDYGEYIQLFLNGRGEVAGGPIPPGLLGYEAAPEHLSKADRLKKARDLMTEAGYANGINPKTGKPLILYYDVATTGGPEQNATMAWMRQQFHAIGIDLQIRATQYNRFQTKIRTGRAQIFSFGWFADYPDPENFLFLLYGPNGKVLHGGENAANYANAQYDRWYQQLKVAHAKKARLLLIHKMVAQLQRDMPWVWGYYPKALFLRHAWNAPVNINPMVKNALKYEDLDPVKRAAMIKQWNQPSRWVLVVLVLLLLVLVSACLWLHHRKQSRLASKRFR